MQTATAPSYRKTPSGNPFMKRTLFILLAKVREHNDSDPIRVDGYTDRLGTEAHNRALSQARAEAVKRYLVAGGIAENRIRAAGFASERPLSHCGDNLPRPALIACLQPDRRVEVSVGTAR